MGGFKNKLSLFSLNNREVLRVGRRIFLKDPPPREPSDLGCLCNKGIVSETTVTIITRALFQKHIDDYCNKSFVSETLVTLQSISVYDLSLQQEFWFGKKLLIVA